MMDLISLRKSVAEKVKRRKIIWILRKGESDNVILPLIVVSFDLTIYIL